MAEVVWHRAVQLSPAGRGCWDPIQQSLRSSAAHCVVGWPTHGRFGCPFPAFARVQCFAGRMILNRAAPGTAFPTSRDSTRNGALRSATLGFRSTRISPPVRLNASLRVNQLQQQYVTQCFITFPAFSWAGPAWRRSISESIRCASARSVPASNLL
jgi:hypothetical protein